MKIAANLFSRNKLIALSQSDKQYEFIIKKNKKISYRNRIIDFQIEKDDNGICFIATKDIRYPIELISCKQNKYEILINGVTYYFSIETPFSLQRRKIITNHSVKSAGLEIKAPMPGKIIEVMVKPNQKIKEGDPLVILEAMKMQNIITSEKEGIIKKIQINPADNVEKGDLLLTVKL